jgi:hypothetical protein
MPTTRTTHPELSPERIATRHLVVALKQLVKADAVTVRSAKLAVRLLQNAGAREARSPQSGAAPRSPVRARQPMGCGCRAPAEGPMGGRPLLSRFRLRVLCAAARAAVHSAVLPRESSARIATA